MRNNTQLFLDGNPCIVLTEWLPIGAHFIYSLQKRFGCHMLTPTQASLGVPVFPTPGTDFFITGKVDEEPNAAVVNLEKAEVGIRVVEYRHMEFIRLESVIEIEETGAAWQEENIGIEVSRGGRISYGIKLIDGGYGLDDLAKVIADISHDTSIVLDTLLSTYQRRLLDVVFSNASKHRDKFLVVVAESVCDEKGVCSLRELLSNNHYRAKIRQILGHWDAQDAVILSDNEFLLSGENGILLVSRNPETLWPLLRAFSLMHGITTFLSNLFSRSAWLWDSLNQQEKRIRDQEQEDILDIQAKLSDLSEQQCLLRSAPEFIRRDKEHLKDWMIRQNVEQQAKVIGMEIFEYMARLFDDLDERLATAELTISTLGADIENIRQLASTLSEKETHHINRAMNILTVVSVIILPLTLITGIYGMNFQAYHPPSGQVPTAFWNMPELYWNYAYPTVLGFMLVVAISLFMFFRHIGLFGKKRNKK